MTGYINNIMLNDHGYEYGYITGDDGFSYSFDGRSLLGSIHMENCDYNDEVEFEPVPPTGNQKYGRANRVLLIKFKAESTHNKTSEPTNPSVQKETIDFFYAGFAVHMNRHDAYEQYLKPNSKENVIIDKLSKILYISRIGHHFIDQRSKFEFCLAGTTKILKQFIQGKCEFLIVLSCFNSTDWQAKNLIVEREIRKRREIADRRPLVNFYILISNAQNLISEIEKTKGSTNAAIIPFTFIEILNCSSKAQLTALFVNRFSEYLYENNMLGETTAIDDDNLLFGDRGKLADLIMDRCQKNAFSGIFGLRRSGKTSVLKAVLRRLDKADIKYVKIESRSELENLDSWKTALYDIAKKIRQASLGIFQNEDETRTEFVRRLKLNSSEEDYQKRPSVCFVEDVKLYSKNHEIFVIAIDEIELITFNTAKTKAWSNVEAYCGFWGALRDCGCPLIICGVNSTINELNTISFNGETGDNPMYKRILSCSDFSDTYLPSFTDKQTLYMINTLGGYSNIGFSNVYTEINNAFGGQPYAIRQFCSYVFKKVKHLRTPDKVYEVSKATIGNLLIEFQESVEGNSLCEIILQHLTIFVDEYEMLKRLALSPEKYRKIDFSQVDKIDHLQKYGLISYDSNTKYVLFKIQSIYNYICRRYTKDPIDMTNEERREYIQTSVAECEIKLKTYLCNYFIYTLNGEVSCRNIMNSYINSPSRYKPVSPNHSNVPLSDPNTCNIRDFFDHKKFIMYFSSIKTIIRDNWPSLGQKFESIGITKEKFVLYMEDLNAGRNDADHYDAEDLTTYPDGWNINDNIMQNFENALRNLKPFFEII